MDKRKSPLWFTLDRKSHLISLFYRSKGFCVFGHELCPYPEHHYTNFIDGLIADWQSEDRQQRIAEAQAQRRLYLHLGERRYPIRGQFNAISKDVFYDKQPQFYIVGLGISGLTFIPFAKVRLPSSYLHLYIDLGDSLKTASKSQRRKAIRYGKPLPKETTNTVDERIRQAVKHVTH